MPNIFILETPCRQEIYGGCIRIVRYMGHPNTHRHTRPAIHICIMDTQAPHRTSRALQANIYTASDDTESPPPPTFSNVFRKGKFSEFDKKKFRLTKSFDGSLRVSLIKHRICNFAGYSLIFRKYSRNLTKSSFHLSTYKSRPMSMSKYFRYRLCISHLQRADGFD